MRYTFIHAAIIRWNAFSLVSRPALMARCAVRGLVAGGISGMELGMTNFRLQSAFHSLLSPSVSDTMASLFSSMVRKLFLSK